MDLLIENGYAYLQGEFKKTNILLSEGKIKEIGLNIRTSHAEKIDATGKIILPGFVNTHTHIAMGGLRGYGEGLPLERWLREKIWPREEKLTAKEIELGTKLSLCELLRSGVTSVADMYLKEMGTIAQACEESGIRAFLSYAVIDGQDANKAQEEVKKLKKFIKEMQGLKNSRLVPCAAAHSLYATSQEALVEAKEIAKREGLKFFIHAAETRKEVFDCLKKTGKYPIEYLNERGILDEDTVLAHASYVTKREIRIIAKQKSAVSHCPVSNLKLATGGICPLFEYAKAGVTVSVGTDGCASNNSLNYFESLKMTSLLQKHLYWKAELFGGREMLEIGTQGGARALGLKGGTLTKGKAADLVILKKQANLAPVSTIIDNIVFAGSPSNVETVIVDGKVVMEQGTIKTMDEEGIIDEISK